MFENAISKVKDFVSGINFKSMTGSDAIKIASGALAIVGVAALVKAGLNGVDDAVESIDSAEVAEVVVPENVTNISAE